MPEKALSYKKLTVLFTVIYLVSYLTRINYAAVITEMVSATGLTKAALSAAVTGIFITYGAGQLLSGFLGDRLSPKLLISLGLGVSTLMNLLLPLCTTAAAMTAVWCVNGLAQAFMWPPLVRLMNGLMTPEEYSRATVSVTLGGSLGTVVVYLTAPLLISLAGWKCVFWASALCGILMLAVWLPISRRLRFSAPEASASRLPFRVFLTPVMGGVLAIAAVIGFLRDGVTTWMPSFVAETYNLENQIAILTGVALPLVAVISIRVAGKLFQTRFRDPIVCGGVILAFGAAAALGLAAFSGTGAALSVVLTALITGACHGSNLTIIGILPACFRKHGSVATASGVINSAVYVGSAASAYGGAVIAETAGWNAVLWLWVGLAIVGTAVCFLCVRPWQQAYGDANS